MSGTLYLVATPIGNLGDLSPRAAQVLSEADFIAAEDTRVSMKLLSHLALRRPLVSYHQHNRASAGPAILARLLAGTGTFLVGVHLLTANIEQLATGRLKELFGRAAHKRLVNVGVGAAATALIQSSGVTTVLIVGFVNVGAMDLYQAAAMIMGANIGTTVTAHILRLSGGDGGFLLRLIAPTTLAPAMAIAGILLFMLAKGDRLREVGQMLLGFGVLFTGMFQMEAAVRPLRELPAFAQLFQAMTNPILGVLVGAGLSGVSVGFSPLSQAHSRPRMEQ